MAFNIKAVNLLSGITLILYIKTLYLGDHKFNIYTEAIENR